MVMNQGKVTVRERLTSLTLVFAGHVYLIIIGLVTRNDFS